MSDNTSFAHAPEALLKAQKMANVLDTAIKLPIIPFRIGLDSIIGLLPGVGDLAMLLAGMRIVFLGNKIGLPRALIKQMVVNLLIDFALGFVPILGDVIDIFYKANQKNVRLMERWWVSQHKGDIDAEAARKLAQWEAELDQ
jgi:hypothetical protein